MANEVNKLIKYYRHRTDDINNCFVIDAFRNPIEVEFFRNRFEQFYLVSIFASEDTRVVRLKNKLEQSHLNLDSKFGEYFEKIDQRDWGSD